MTFDYPLWLRIDHWLNMLFVRLIIRSGLEILATHPKLYWHDDSRPGSEWAVSTATSGDSSAVLPGVEQPPATTTLATRAAGQRQTPRIPDPVMNSVLADFCWQYP